MRDRCDVVEAMLLENRDAESVAEFYKALYEPIEPATPQDDLRRILGV